MCWISKEINGTEKVANEDVFVFKMLIDTSHRRPNTLLSPICRYFYSIGEDYSILDKIKVKWSTYDKVYFINEGFHSYSTDCYVTKRLDGSSIVENQVGEVIGRYPYIESYNFVIVSCIIPKGTTYYENERGEIVSEQIRIIKKYSIIR